MHPIRIAVAPLIALAIVLCPAQEAVQAHATGENYVWVNVDDGHLQGRFEIPFRDLTLKLGIALPGGDDEARQAIDETAPVVREYIRQHFRITANGVNVPIEFTTTGVEVLGIGTFAQYYYRTPAFDIPNELAIHDTLLFENDRFHRSLIAIEYNRKAGETYGDSFAAMIFGPSNPDQTLDLLKVRGVPSPFDFIWQGVLHIWIGIDHILFLVALLLPAVFIRNGTQWTPVPRFRVAFLNIIKIVTIFTVAHSITLTLAALDLVRLPPRLVEATIALSIVLVALNTVFQRFPDGYWVVIFFFGLFHGLGFASVLGHLQFRVAQLVRVMFAFNAGIEIGQAAIVACAFPIIFLLRRSSFFPAVVLRGGSFAICLVAFYWFIERALGL